MSKVIVVKFTGNSEKDKLSEDIYKSMLIAGLIDLSGEDTISSALKKYLPSGVIGMKTNCLVGKRNSTPVPLTNALIKLLIDSGFENNNLIIWERSNRELADAGYELNASNFSHRCFGTDTKSIGYSSDFYSYNEVSSLVSKIMTDVVDYNINMPVLKDHSLAGLSAGMKNMYGAIHNPNKYHENNCDPYCAHVYNLEPIKSKNKLTILDAVNVQYNGGPGYVRDFMENYDGIIISDDPVACDRIGLEIVEFFRRKNDHKSLEEVNRPAKYLKTAESLGLGIADIEKIDISVIEIDEMGTAKRGELF